MALTIAFLAPDRIDFAAGPHRLRYPREVRCRCIPGILALTDLQKGFSFVIPGLEAPVPCAGAVLIRTPFTAKQDTMNRLLLVIVLLTASSALAQSNDRAFCLRSADTKEAKVCFPMTEQQQPGSPTEEARLHAELERLAEAARARQTR